MKKIIFVLLLLLAISAPAWAGHLQDMQRAVIALNSSAAPDTTDPTLTTVAADGTDYTFTYSEAVTADTTGELCSDYAVTWSTAGAETLSYASGDGTTTVHCTGSAAIVYGETVTDGLDYTPGTIVDLAGTPNALASITSKAVANNTPAGYLYDFEEEGVPSGMTVLVNTPDFDAAGIDGESMYIASHTNLRNEGVYFSTSHTAGTIIWHRVRINCPYLPTGLTTDLVFATCRNGSFNRGSFSVTNVSGTSYFKVAASGGSSVVLPNSLSTDTTYIVDFGCKEGTGSDAIASIAYSTSGVPAHSGDNYAIVSNGTNTSTLNSIVLGMTPYSTETNSLNCYMDNIETWEE